MRATSGSSMLMYGSTWLSTPHAPYAWSCPTMMPCKEQYRKAACGKEQPTRLPIQLVQVQPGQVMRVPLSPWSPNLNAYAECWARAVQKETLSQLILFEEHSLRHALMEYTTHYHQERPHQGMGNIVLMPASSPKHDESMRCRERLGGLLQYYYREAA
jgi:hypothetical protein